MARTPLASLLQDAVAEVALDDGRRTTRRDFLRRGAVAGSRSHCARAICAGGEGGGRRGRGSSSSAPASPGSPAPIDSGRRDTPPRSTRPRIASAGGAGPSRGEFADGQIYERGGELIDQGHNQIRHLAQELGLKLDNLLPAEVERHRAARLVRREAVPYAQMTDDIKQVWQKIHADSLRRATRRCSTTSPSAAGARPPLDRRLDRGVRARTGWAPGSAGCSTSPTRSSTAPTRRSRARSTCSTCSVIRPGPVPRLREVEREIPRPRRQRPDHGGLRARLPGRSRLGSELVAKAAGTATRSRSSSGRAPRRSRPTSWCLRSRSRSSAARSIFTGEFLGAQAAGDPEQGMGTNSKLHLQLSGAAGSTSARTERRSPTPGTRTRGRCPAPRRVRPGSSSTTRAATSARASAPGSLTTRAEQFLAQIEPVSPGLKAADGTGRQRSTTGPATSGRAVRTRTGRSGSTRRSPGSRADGGQRAFLRRAHVDRLPGLPERRRRDRGARGRRSDRRPGRR